MPNPLTEQSTVKCAHQGTVQLAAGQSKLSVGGAKVLVQGDLMGATIQPDCTTVPDANTATVKCTAVTSVIPGVAAKLKVDGKPVLLDNAQGLTSGTVGGTPQTWSVQSAGQSKLSTV